MALELGDPEDTDESWGRGVMGARKEVNDIASSLEFARQRLATNGDNLFSIVREMNKAGYRRPDGALWTAAALEDAGVHDSLDGEWDAEAQSEDQAPTTSNSSTDEYLRQLDQELADEGYRELAEVGCAPVPPSDLFAVESVAPRFAIPQVAVRKHINVLYGDVGTGKSTLIQAAIAANGTGEPFVGFEFEGPQTFVVFDWENGREDFTKTLRRLGLEVPSGFFYYDSPDYVNLDTPEGRERVREIVTKLGATCVIFDSMADAFPGTPENDGEKIRLEMAATKELAVDLEVAIVLVSHEPKADHASATHKLAGHGMWARKADQMWRIRRTGEHRLLSHEKYRAIGRRRALRITLETEGDPDLGSMSLVAQETDTQAERAEALAQDVEKLEHLLETEDMPRGRIREVLSWSENRFTNALKASERVWQPGGRGKPYSVRAQAEEVTLEG
jgi:KaiC/GvpD/RAD55 family RecA-like ATPase